MDVAYAPYLLLTSLYMVMEETMASKIRFILVTISHKVSLLHLSLIFCLAIAN